MRISAILLSFLIVWTVPVFSHDAAVAAATTACGPVGDRLKVNSENAKGLLTQPEPGKALVYVIEDDGVANRIIGGNITWRVGLDGAWVAALKRHSPYTTFSVTPGEHHLCVNWQSSLEYLAKAIDRRQGPIRWLNVSPQYDKIRSDPRFVAQVARLKLPASAARR